MLLFNPEPAVILSYDHRECAYSVLTAEDVTEYVDALPMERLVCRLGTQLAVKATALQSPLIRGSAHQYEVVPVADLSEDDTVLCTLRVPDDETADGMVPVSAMGFHHHNMQRRLLCMDSMEENMDLRTPPVPFNVSVSAVVKRVLLDELPPLFRGVLLPQ